LYKIGIDKFLGNCLIRRLEAKQFGHVGELRAALKPESNVGPGKWVDLAGLLAPDEVVQKMLCDIEEGRIGSLEQAEEAFRSMHANYTAYEWAWAANILQQRLGKTLENVTPDDVIAITVRWREAVVELDRMLHADARKEFAATAQIGYGLDGRNETKQDDFEQVRGTFEENDFVLEIEKHIAAKTALADDLIGRMEQLRCRQPSAGVCDAVSAERAHL
jgi:hypothetical protein